MTRMRLLTVREVADRLGFASDAPVRRMCRAGELEHYKIRGRIRIRGEALATYLQAHKRDVTPPAAAAPPRRQATGRRPPAASFVDRAKTPATPREAPPSADVLPLAPVRRFP